MPWQYHLFWQRYFIVDRTKQPGGCIRISEKCVFYTLKSLKSLLNGFIGATTVSQVLFLDLINFQKTNTRRAVGENRAEVFSLKKNQDK